MNKLRIYVDFTMTASAANLLREGTADHQLIFAPAPTASILAGAQPDSQFATVHVAFGQPDPRAVAEAPQLQWIHISTSGITRYDNPEFRAMIARRNIPLSNSASVYGEPCAQHALSFILAQSRNLPRALQTRTANGTPAWNDLRSSCIPLRDQTVLIVGYGTIGKRLTELLRPFGVGIVACRRRARGDEGVPILNESELAPALAKADHVVNILPDSAATRGFFNADRFSMMKSSAVFYNIGRGATIDQEALLDALRTRRIQAAWLDVTEPEPLPDDHPLWGQPNCFITPHVAGGHVDEAGSLVRHFLNNLDRFVRGEPLLDRIS